MSFRTILAAVLRSPGKLRIEKLRLPGPRADEILVRIVACGICHTDIGIIEAGSSDPVVLGHEGAGVIEEIGSLVRGFRKGDHVVLSYQSCGHCKSCKSNHPAYCEKLSELNFGFQRDDGTNALEEASGVQGHFFGQSSFATHALVTKRNCVKVSKDFPLELLAALGCGLQTGAATVMKQLATKKGQSIAIFGTGSVGLAAVMAARIVKAYPIIAVDQASGRLKLARELGATHAIDTRKSDVSKRIRAITGCGVDRIVENTGNSRLVRLAGDLLNPHGRAATLATFGSRELPGDRKVLEVVQGDAIPQMFIPKMIRLYKAGKFPFNRLVRFYDFKNINKAIADSTSGKTIKPIVRM